MSFGRGRAISRKMEKSGRRAELGWRLEDVHIILLD
jgi:hypothetical protein